MEFITSCCGRKRIRLPDEEALLPVYHDDTELQRKLHEKMHTYQMLRAMGLGFMPSNEQAIVHLRTLMASDILRSDNHELSGQGRRLVDLCKRWLNNSIDLLSKKNDLDQIQNAIWFLTKARVEFDGASFTDRIQSSQKHTDSTALFQSLKTVSDLLFSNSDFRLFLDDLMLLSRQVLADSATSLSTASAVAAESIQPSAEGADMLTGAGNDDSDAPAKKDLVNESKAVGQVVRSAVVQTGEDTLSSARNNFSGDAKETILARLKAAISKLRRRPDYENSVNTIGILLRRYIETYTQPIEDVASGLQTDVSSNAAFNRALSNIWSLAKSLGNPEEWVALEKCLEKFSSHAQENPHFDAIPAEIGSILQKMLLEPDFFDQPEQQLQDLEEKSSAIGSIPKSMREDTDRLLSQVWKTWKAVLSDHEIRQFVQTSTLLMTLMTSGEGLFNQKLIQDGLNVFFPLLITAVQHVPIPRLELSTPEIDLLLENLILQPGKTVNASSFLPFRLRIESVNNVEIRKARFRTHSSLTSLITLKLDGMSIRADNIGYWLRTRLGLARFSDEGIASFRLDERGMDVHLDLEVCRERMEQILTLRDVRVKIHHLDYSLQRSKFSWLAWIVKPLVRPILRRTMENELSTAIGDLLHAANRELLFARERLRATRIAEPSSMWRFIRAIMARLTPEEDPDMYTAIGVRPSGNRIFRGRYAPGSIVKLWEQEVDDALYKVQDGQADGWRNEIFNVHTIAAH